MGDGGGAGVRAQVPAALVVEVAACRRRQAAHVIMVMMVIKGMDGVSTNHSCEWTWIHTHTNKKVKCLTTHNSDEGCEGVAGEMYTHAVFCTKHLMSLQKENNSQKTQKL